MNPLVVSLAYVYNVRFSAMCFLDFIISFLIYLIDLFYFCSPLFGNDKSKAW
jgi:hypothetical protein